MGYINPLLELPAGRALQTLPSGERAELAELLRALRAQANVRAKGAWARRKGKQAAFYRAAATYARHTAHALTIAQAPRASRLRHAGAGVAASGQLPPGAHYPLLALPAWRDVLQLPVA